MATGNYRHHCVAVRARVTGSGFVYLKLKSLEYQNSNEQILTPIGLPNPIPYPNILANYIQPRMQLEFWIEGNSTDFVLREISFFTKPVASGYPG